MNSQAMRVSEVLEQGCRVAKEPVMTDGGTPFQKQRTFRREWRSRFGCLWDAFKINYPQSSPLGEHTGDRMGACCEYTRNSPENNNNTNGEEEEKVQQVQEHKNKKCISSNSIIIGWDTEFVNKGGKNKIVSYQVHCITQYGSFSAIHFPKQNKKTEKRLKFNQLVGMAIEMTMEFELLKRWPKKKEVFLVAHFAAADFPGLSDVQNIYKQLDPVRKTMVSINKPIGFKYSDCCGNCREVEVRCYDTLLLTPAKTKSLKDLGDLVGLEKVELEEGVIERMDLLLQNDPEKFVEYALMDAEISARFFELMRGIYFGLNPKAKHLPATLGGIGVPSHG